MKTKIKEIFFLLVVLSSKTCFSQSIDNWQEMRISRYVYDSLFRHTNYTIVDSNLPIRETLTNLHDSANLTRRLKKIGIDVYKFERRWFLDSISLISHLTSTRFALAKVNSNELDSLLLKSNNEDDYWAALRNIYGLDGLVRISKLYKYVENKALYYFFYFSYSKGEHCCSCVCPAGWFSVKLLNNKVVEFIAL